MDQSTKQRLVGIAVVFALAVIFLPMILDGAGVRKNDLNVVIPPQPVITSNPDFDQKIIELHARVDALPELQPGIVDELSPEPENNIERDKVAEPGKKTPSDVSKKAANANIARIGGDSWVLQVGSFKDRSKALGERDRLRKSNIAAVFIEPYNGNGSTSYRVRLGPFLNRDQAKVALNKIKAKHNINGFITRYDK